MYINHHEPSLTIINHPYVYIYILVGGKNLGIPGKLGFLRFHHKKGGKDLWFFPKSEMVMVM